MLECQLDPLFLRHEAPEVEGPELPAEQPGHGQAAIALETQHLAFGQVRGEAHEPGHELAMLANASTRSASIAGV